MLYMWAKDTYKCRNWKPIREIERSILSERKNGRAGCDQQRIYSTRSNSKGGRQKRGRGKREIEVRGKRGGKESNRDFTLKLNGQ